MSVAVGFGASSGVAASSTRAITVVIVGSGNLHVTTTYRGRIGHYTLARNRTIRVPAGSRVTLVERPLNGAAFGGWSGGGCRPSLARCALTARRTTVIRARFVATATKTTIACRNVIYSGSPQTPCSAQVTGQGGLRAAAGVVYVGDHTNAGTVTATARFAGSTSHLGSVASTTFVIARASASVRPSITNLPTSATNGASFTPTVIATGDGATSVTSNSTGICTVEPSGKVTFVGVGTCSLSASVAAGTNYTAATGIAQTFTVAPTPLIVDTDIYSSVDDVGALATAFALQNAGEANVVATIVNTRTSRPAVATDSWKCAAALAQFYGSTHTLLGSDMPNNGPDPTTIPNFIGPCAGFASPSTPVPASAVSVYRRALASQPDGSVVIASIGYFENLDALLHSGPDIFSPLTGSQLVARKVRLLVAMAGCNPNSVITCSGVANPENNIVGNIPAAVDVAANWPTKSVWSGYEVGIQVKTGQTIPGTDTTSPVRAAYTAFGTTPGNWCYSFDLTAVYHAIRPFDAALTELGPGTNAVNSTTGANTFTPGAGNQYYLSLTNASGLDASLNALLDAAP